MSNSSGLNAFIDQDDPGEVRVRSVARLFKMIGRYRGAMALGTGLIGLGTFATLSEPRLFGYAIDEAILPKRWDRLTQLAYVYLIIVIARVATTMGQAYLFEWLGQRITQTLRIQLFSHLQRLPVSVFDQQPAGKLLTRVTNDVAALGEMFSAGFVSIVSNALMVMGILIWLLVLDLKLGLIAAAIFPLLVGASVYFSGLLRGAYRDSRSRLSSLNAFLAENLNGMKVVNLFNRQRLHLERFDRVNQWYTDSLVSTVRVYALFQPTITICSGISLALVIYFGGQQVANGSLRVGILVAFFSYVMTVFQPVREIADKWNIFLSGMISAERIFQILAWPVEMGQSVADSAEVEPLVELKGHIVFENVWFAYEAPLGKERWVLKDFTLEIQAGMRVGVVGHTGAGKTTLISLLMRFYEPQRGRILLDGKDLREYDKRRLRASIGIIQQDAFVFSGSIEDNLTFWRSPESPGAVAAREALRSMGYERWWDKDRALDIRERGTNLSMGEKQVLAFGRAVAARPRIWILDEATANMDSQTEEMLQQSLAKVSQQRTSILIAHRLATVKAADLILVLHKGSLQECGNHTALLAQGGLYARLYRFQQAQDAVLAASSGHHIRAP